ncbi:MAG: CinA family protein [Eubacteriales bacterium]|jgi:nicotinamide-nucleotide amidase|nr:CinA family protein [Eubacteriales bacterium]
MGQSERAEKLVQLLASCHLSLALAESCTGGSIAGEITDIPGASQVLAGGAVVYTPEAKTIFLGIPAPELPAGCVGEELTRVMAARVMSLLGTDLALAVTGALGPTSPAESIQVGEVYISIAGLGKQEAKKFIFAGDRQTIKEAAVAASIDNLLAYIARWYIA